MSIAAISGGGRTWGGKNPLQGEHRPDHVFPHQLGLLHDVLPLETTLRMTACPVNERLQTGMD